MSAEYVKGLLQGYEQEIKNVESKIAGHYQSIEVLTVRKAQMEGAAFAARNIVQEMERADKEVENKKAESKQENNKTEEDTATDR